MLIAIATFAGSYLASRPSQPVTLADTEPVQQEHPKELPLDVELELQKVIPAVVAAANRQDLQTALSLLKAGQELANRNSFTGMQNQFMQAGHLLSLLIQQELAIGSARELITQTPASDDANFKLAMYFGLRKRDWTAATRHTKKLSNPFVRRLFEREASSPKAIGDIYWLAENWWRFLKRKTVLKIYRHWIWPWRGIERLSTNCPRT